MNILIKPVITEKMMTNENLNRFGFVVDNLLTNWD